MHLHRHVKYWDFSRIDAAEAEADSVVFHIDPLRDISVGEDVRVSDICESRDLREAVLRDFLPPQIKCMTRQSDNWMILDDRGHFIRLWCRSKPVEGEDEKVLLEFKHEIFHTFNCGPLTGLDVSPLHDLTVFGGADGAIWVMNYRTLETLHSTKFSAGVAFLRWCPEVCQIMCLVSLVSCLTRLV